MISPSILILGGDGYIGSGLKARLSSRYSIDSLDLNWFSTAPDATPRDIHTLERGDLSRYHTVILLAGHSSVRMCAGDWASTEANNVKNFEHLLSILGTQRFIYASSSSVYGASRGTPRTESDPLDTPISEYDRSKQLIDTLALASDVEYYGLRFGTVNGGSPHMRVDLMMNAMYHATKTKGSLELSNPTISRPILGLSDLARAVAAIIDSQNDRRGIYNLASCNAQTSDIAEVVSRLTHSPIINGASNQGVVYDFSISTDYFERIFNFEFRDTLESIVTDIAEWYDAAHKTTRHEHRAYTVIH